MTEECPVKCGGCRCTLLTPLEHGLVDAHSQKLHDTSLPYNECPSLQDHTRLFLDQENLPDFVHQSVMQTGFTTGRIKCFKCGARLGAFNFIKDNYCSCGMHVIPPAHLTLSNVDYSGYSVASIAAAAAKKQLAVASTEECHSSEESSSEPLLKVWSSEQQASSVDLPNSASNKFLSFFTKQGSSDRDVPPEPCGSTYSIACSNPNEDDVASLHTTKSDSIEGCTSSAEADLEDNLMDCNTPSKSIDDTKRRSSFNHTKLPQQPCSSSISTASTTSCKYLELDSDVLTDKSSESGDWVSLSSVTINNDHPMPEHQSNPLTARGLTDQDVPSVDFVMGRGARPTSASASEQDVLDTTSDDAERQSPNSIANTAGINTVGTINNVGTTDDGNSDNNGETSKSNGNRSSISNPLDSETSSSNSADAPTNSSPTTSNDCTVPEEAVTSDAELLDYPDHLVCPICLELLFSPFTVKHCGHIFCEPCLRRLGRPSPTNTACPLCREIIGACQPAAECTREVRQKYPVQVAERLKFEQNNSVQHLPLPWLQSYRFLNFDSGTRHPRSGVYSRYSNWWRTALWIFWVDAIGFLLIITLNWFLSQTIHGGDPQRVGSVHHPPPRSEGMPSHILLDGSGDGGPPPSNHMPYFKSGDGMGRDIDWARYGGSGDGVDMDNSMKLGGILASTDYQKYKNFHTPHTVKPIRTTTYAPSFNDRSAATFDLETRGVHRMSDTGDMRSSNYRRMIQDLYNRFDKFNNPFIDPTDDTDGGSTKYNVISKRQTRSKRGTRLRQHHVFKSGKVGGDSLGRRDRGANDDVPRSSREGVRWWLA